MYPSETAWFIEEYEKAVRRQSRYPFLQISSQRLQIDADCEQMYHPAKENSTKDWKRIKLPGL